MTTFDYVLEIVEQTSLIILVLTILKLQYELYLMTKTTRRLASDLRFFEESLNSKLLPSAGTMSGGLSMKDMKKHE